MSTYHLQLTVYCLHSNSWSLHFSPPAICWLRRGFGKCSGPHLPRVGEYLRRFWVIAGLSGIRYKAHFFIADAWVLKRIWSEGHFCPFKLFSIRGHREVTSASEVTYPPKHYGVRGVYIGCMLLIVGEAGGNYLCIPLRQGAWLSSVGINIRASALYKVKWQKEVEVHRKKNKICQCQYVCIYNE